MGCIDIGHCYRVNFIHFYTSSYNVITNTFQGAIQGALQNCILYGKLLLVSCLKVFGRLMLLLVWQSHTSRSIKQEFLFLPWWLELSHFTMQYLYYAVGMKFTFLSTKSSLQTKVIPFFSSCSHAFVPCNRSE